MDAHHHIGAVALGALAACGFDTGGVGSGTASVGSVSGSSEATSEASSATSPTASATTMTATDATATATATATDATATSPTDPSDSVDSTVTDVDTGETTTATATATDATADDATTTSGGGAVHQIQTTDQSNCTQPLWCFSNDVWNEYGDPIYGQQCFTSPVAPPFELISVHYVVADVAPELTNFIIEVHERDDDGPTAQITFAEKSAADATAGSHEHVFAEPVQILDTEFCVGFATPYVGLAAALGMAVDVGTTVGDTSFIRLEGPIGCVIPNWSDVIEDEDPTPSGNWCIDVQIRELE